MAAIDASIVNIALPTLHATFHVGMLSVEWVAVAYLLTLAALLPVIGRLSDQIGRSRLYTLGFGVFALGSGLCSLAPGLATLVVFRVLQALGAVALQANSIAIVSSLAHDRDTRAAAIGVQGAAQALGLSVGPFAGGVLIHALGWRSIFYLNVPIGIVGTAAAVAFLPREMLGKALEMDLRGSLLLSAALVAFSLFLTNAGSWPVVWLAILAGFTVSCALLFRAHALRHEDAVLDLRALAQPRIWKGLLTGALSYTVMYGALFLLPFFLERVEGAMVDVAGRILMAVPVAMSLASATAGRMTHLLSGRRLMSVGLGVMMAACAGFALLLPGPGWAMLAVLAAVGLGMGLFTPANNASVMSAAPGNLLGSIGGVLNMARTIGMMLGVSLGGLSLALAGSGVSQSTDWAVRQASSYRLGFAVLAGTTAVALALGMRNKGPAVSTAGP